MHGAPPTLVDRHSPFLLKAAEAMEKVFGRPTAFIRCGGSIPIVNLLLQKLGIPTVLPGFGLPDDQIHPPNEKLSISNYIHGISSMVRYFEGLNSDFHCNLWRTDTTAYCASKPQTLAV